MYSNTVLTNREQEFKLLLKGVLKKINRKKLHLILDLEGMGIDLFLNRLKKNWINDGLVVIDRIFVDDLNSLVLSPIAIMKKSSCCISDGLQKKYSVMLNWFREKENLDYHKMKKGFYFEKNKYLQELAEFFIELGNESDKIIIFCLRNIQFADEFALNVIKKVFLSLSAIKNIDNKIRFVVSAKDEELFPLSQFLSILEEKKRIIKIEFSDFTKNEVAAVVGNRLNYFDIEKKNSAIVGFLYRKSHGNPLYLDELLHYLLISKFIIKKDRFWQITLPLQYWNENFDLDYLIKQNLLSLNLSDVEFKLLRIIALIKKPAQIQLYQEIFFDKQDIDVSAFIKKVCSKNILIEIDSFEGLFVFADEILRKAIISSLEKYEREQLNYFIAINIELKSEKLSFGFRGLNFYQILSYHYSSSLNKIDIKKNNQKYQKAIYYSEKSASVAASNKKYYLVKIIYDRLLSIYSDRQSVEKIELLLKKAVLENRIGSVFEVIRSYKLALKIAESHDLAKLIAECRIQLSHVLVENRLYDKSLKLLKNAFIYFNTIKDKRGMARVHIVNGIYHLNNYQFDDALEAFYKAENFVVGADEKKLQVLIYNHIGTVLTKRKEYDKAMTVYRKGLIIAEQDRNLTEVSSLEGKIAVLYYYQGLYAKSLASFKKQLEDDGIICNKRVIGKIYNGIGSIYHDMGYFHSALKYTILSLKYVREYGERYDISVVLFNLAEIYKELGFLNKAMFLYLEHINLAKKLNHQRALLDSMFSTAKLNRYLNEYKMAHDLYDKIIKLCRLNGIKAESSLFEKASLYYFEKKYKEADEYLSLSIAEFDERSKQKFVFFMSNVLYQKIKFRQGSEKEKRIEKLKEMMAETKNEIKQAYLNYELFYLSGKSEYCEVAKAIYNDLYKEMSRYEFKVRLDDLKSCS